MAEAVIDRLPDQKMADVELDDFGQCGDSFGGFEIEPVTGVNFETLSPRELCAFPNAQPLRLCFSDPMAGEGVAPGTGVYLDDRRAEDHGRLDLRRLGGDQQRAPTY